MGILEGVLTWLRLGHTQGSEGCIRDSPLRFAEIPSFQIFFRRPASRWIAIRKNSDGLSIFKLEKQKVLPPDERNPDLGYVKPWLPSLSGLLMFAPDFFHQQSTVPWIKHLVPSNEKFHFPNTQKLPQFYLAISIAPDPFPRFYLAGPHCCAKTLAPCQVWNTCSSWNPKQCCTKIGGAYWFPLQWSVQKSNLVITASVNLVGLPMDLFGAMSFPSNRHQFGSPSHRSMALWITELAILGTPKMVNVWNPPWKSCWDSRVLEALLKKFTLHWHPVSQS